MDNWYLLSLAALLLLGSQRFLYKIAAEKGCSSALTTTIFMATVTVLSAMAFFFSADRAVNLPALFGFALLNSASFAFATIANIEALKHLPAGITFPLTRLSLVLVIIVSLLYFDEQLGLIQWLGILLAFAVVMVLSKEARDHTNVDGSLRLGLIFIGACIICGALASISSKLAAEAVSKSGFMLFSYLFGTGFSLLIEKKWGKGWSRNNLRWTIQLGLLMGVLNFVGFYAFLSALETGPLSSVAMITGMHFVIAIILSVLLYKEQMTLRRGAGICLTLLAVFFLKHF
jgi:drug/metabolite transporter (DMT)-like permease